MGKKRKMIVFKMYLVFVSVVFALLYGCAFITVEIDDGTQSNEQQETERTETTETENDNTEILN